MIWDCALLCQVLHGSGWCCLLPPALPAALPGPTQPGARPGGWDTELRWHRHKLRRSPLVVTAGQVKSTPLWGSGKACGHPQPGAGCKERVCWHVAPARTHAPALLLPEPSGADLRQHAPALLQHHAHTVWLPELCQPQEQDMKDFQRYGTVCRLQGVSDRTGFSDGLNALWWFGIRVKCMCKVIQCEGLRTSWQSCESQGSHQLSKTSHFTI